MGQEANWYEVTPAGVGSPAIMYLHAFGRIVHDYFDVYPTLVGSALEKKEPRDIDVRLLLTNKRAFEIFGVPADINKPHGKWSVLCMAFSALGKQLTGLNIDFQIQVPALAAQYEGKPALVLGKQ